MKSFFALFTLIALSGCGAFVKTSLVEPFYGPSIPDIPEIGYPVPKVLYDFTGPINLFWTSASNITLSKVDSSMVVELKEAGENYDCWGTELNDLSDLSKRPVLKVTTRAEGTSNPELAISLKDNEGIDTNFDRPSQKIKRTPNSTDYYFNFEGKWKQSWPKDGIVDSTRVTEILFFVNPGKENWTGTIVIDKIETLPVSEIPEAN